MIHIPDSVFPQDTDGNLLCPRCRKPVARCDCEAVAAPPFKGKAQDFTPFICLDKQGRRGKLVTLVSGLPAQEDFLKNLCRELKQSCGGGGTHYIQDGTGCVEIQGEHVKRVDKFLANRGLRCKMRG